MQINILFKNKQFSILTQNSNTFSNNVMNTFSKLYFVYFVNYYLPYVNAQKIIRVIVVQLACNSHFSGKNSIFFYYFLKYQRFYLKRNLIDHHYYFYNFIFKFYFLMNIFIKFDSFIKIVMILLCIQVRLISPTINIKNFI